MKDPNNVRNRYRRYREANQAYGFTWLPFRQWVLVSGPGSYSAEPHHINYEVKLTGAKLKKVKR